MWLPAADPVSETAGVEGAPRTPGTVVWLDEAASAVYLAVHFFMPSMVPMSSFLYSHPLVLSTSIAVRSSFLTAWMN